MRLITKVIRISRAKFHCNRLTVVQDIQDYASLIFWHTLYDTMTHREIIITATLWCKRTNLLQHCFA